MPDPTPLFSLPPEVINAAVGGSAGLLGGGVTAISRKADGRQVITGLFGGMGFGAFVPPLLAHYWGLPPLACGGLGYFGGLMIFGIIAGSQRLGGRIASDPSIVLNPARAINLPAKDNADEPPPPAPPVSGAAT